MKIPIRTIEFFQYILFRLFCFLLNLLPFHFALRLGKWGGRMLYQILSRYRKVAFDNVKFAFGSQKSEREIKQIVIQSFENLGMFGIELVRIPKIVGNLKKYVVIKNEESVFKALEAGKGVILIVSHFGNWEWMGVAAGARARETGVKINAVARPLGNPFLYRYAVESLRGATGLKTISKKGAAREVMSFLDQNEIVCILIDQHERYGSVPVPYFGRDAWTTSLPAMLAVKKEVPVIPVFSFRTEFAPTTVQLGEPFSLINTGDYERDLLENTKQYIKAVEDEIRKRPGDWLWMHARWRSSRTAKAT
ncbi:MAG: lysophospholipid acyltransferase family protein [Candidatus Omnitrophica bacterium]|nr:lysophospholipid acyltransferase family protein [Candidatus Omnitrophota bacterium]